MRHNKRSPYEQACNAQAVVDADAPKMNVLVSAHAEAKQLRRKHDFRPKPKEPKKSPAIPSEFVLEMRKKMERDDTREL